MQEALAKGQVKVSETGSVNELTVENVGTDEVFVQAGDIVKGGRQDRVLSVDLLLPPHSGRVRDRGVLRRTRPLDGTRQGGRQAILERRVGHAVARGEARHAGLRGGAAFAAGRRPVSSGVLMLYPDVAVRQGEIWAKVKETQDRLSHSVGAPVAAAASPSSLQLSLENEKLKQAQEAYIGALQGAGESGDDVVGYVFAINGKINSGDVYASNALFRKMWPKLLAANVTEAIGNKDAAGAAPPR